MSEQRNSMRAWRPLIHRSPLNPLLTPKDWPYPANAVFNPGAIEVNGETCLLVRVEDMRGFSHITLARSKDGVTDWRVDPEPWLKPDPKHAEEKWGLEDPRVVHLKELGKYAVTYVSFSAGGPLVSLALTEDFRSVQRIGPLLPPEDKDASLLPRKVGGRFVLIHRPIIRGEAHIWIAFSPDLRHWGDHQILLPTRSGSWDGHRVGLGPPPLETDEGWLVIYHGVRVTASGSLYRIGLALLDLDEPWRVIRRCEEWVFGPAEPFERSGDVPGVTFITGAVPSGDGKQLRLYYGAADSVVGLAVADLTEILDYLKSSQSPAVKTKKYYGRRLPR